MVRRSELPNGVRVVSEQMPGAPSVTVGLWVENGSRFESARQRGISHFLEHLFFKGTENRTAMQISEEIDAVGGLLNAFTGKESTCYYARVLSEHAPLAMNLLEDIFLRSLLAESEIDRERSVVLQEISQVEDTPDDYIHDLFALRYWPEHPLSFPVCGSAETVGSFRRDDFVRFCAERYRPDRLVVAAAGSIDHETVEDWAAQAFGSLDGRAVSSEAPHPRENRGVFVVEKPLEQIHICLGTAGVPQTTPDRFPAWVMNTALGGGMSSRLFQEVRERRGRAYSVYSFLSAYRDAGYIGVYVGTSPEWLEEVVTVILGELESIAREGLRPQELVRARNQLKGNILLGMETSDSRMSRIAKNEIYFRRDVPLEELASRIDGTTNEEVASLAGRLFRPETMALALLGDLKGHSFENVFSTH